MSHNAIDTAFDSKHRPFFSPPLQRDDDGSRIVTKALNGGPRIAARETVNGSEILDMFHAPSVTRFQSEEKPKNPYEM